MANILYRSGTAGTTAFTIASTNGSVARALTNAEIDGNFYALDQGPTVGTTQLKPNATYSALAGLTSVTATTFFGSLSGTASNVTTNANLTGDVTSVGNATTLANSGVVAGTWNSVTVNAKGLVTAGSNVNTVTAAFNFSDTTQSTSSSTGAVTIAGGLGVAKNIYASGNIFGANLSGTNTGDDTAATIRSKLGITTLSGSNTGDQTLPTTLPHNGTALTATTGAFSNTTESNSTTTGAVTIAGGLGVAKYLYVGGGVIASPDAYFQGGGVYMGAGDIKSYKTVGTTQSQAQAFASSLFIEHLGGAKTYTANVAKPFPDENCGFFGSILTLLPTTNDVYEFDYILYINADSTTNTLSISAVLSNMNAVVISGNIEYNNGSTWVCKANSTTTLGPSSMLLSPDVPITNGVVNLIRVHVTFETGGRTNTSLPAKFYLAATPSNNGSIRFARGSRYMATYLGSQTFGVGVFTRTI